MPKLTNATTQRYIIVIIVVLLYVACVLAQGKNATDVVDNVAEGTANATDNTTTTGNNTRSRNDTNDTNDTNDRAKEHRNSTKGHDKDGKDKNYQEGEQSQERLISRGTDYPFDPATYFMGILFLSTGMTSLLRGHKFNWYSIFIGGFYAIGLCFVLFILKFQNVNNPSTVTRAVYFVICSCAGAAAGLFFVCMWPSGRILVGSVGGFSFAMMMLSARNGGLITSHLWRYIFMGIPTLLLSVLAAFERCFPYVAVVATTLTGSYLLILGVDIFVRTGLLAGFRYLWGFTMPFDYEYVLTDRTIIVLSSIAFGATCLGLLVQGYESGLIAKLFSPPAKPKDDNEKERRSSSDSETSDTVDADVSSTADADIPSINVEASSIETRSTRGFLASGKVFLTSVARSITSSDQSVYGGSDGRRSSYAGKP